VAPPKFWLTAVKHFFSIMIYEMINFRFAFFCFPNGVQMIDLINGDSIGFIIVYEDE